MIEDHPLISLAEYGHDGDTWQIRVPHDMTSATFHFLAHGSPVWLVADGPSLPEKATDEMTAAVERETCLSCGPSQAARLWATMVAAFRRSCSQEHVKPDKVLLRAQDQHETPVPKGFRRVKVAPGITDTWYGSADRSSADRQVHIYAAKEYNKAYGETQPTQDSTRVYPKQWPKFFDDAGHVTVPPELLRAPLSTYPHLSANAENKAASENKGRCPTTDIRFSIEALLKSRGVPQVDGPPTAVFWAGGQTGNWSYYSQYANGQLQPDGAPRVRDRTLSNVDEIITNAVKTLAILCDQHTDCGIVWRSHPEIGTENNGALFWRARLAFVPIADMTNCSLERPEWVEPRSLPCDFKVTEIVARNVSGEVGDGVALISACHPGHPADCGCSFCVDEEVSLSSKRLADDYDGIRERLRAIKDAK